MGSPISYHYSSRYQSCRVQQICLFMHSPKEPHLALLKRILRYIRGTVEQGLQLYQSTTTDITVYSNADWAGCPDTRRSTSGYCVYVGVTILLPGHQRQTTVFRSSTEAEYRVIANAVVEACWVRQLLLELHGPPSLSTIVYCVNISAMYMSSNPVQHQRTKHVEIDLHFVRVRVSLG